VGKGKLQKFAEVSSFQHVFEPRLQEIMHQDYHLKGAWNTQVFKREAPLVLELGCGRGEYSVGLARVMPGKNFIGIDIKGARIWKGARESLEQQIRNVAFLRTRIEFIRSFFGPAEVDEIWLTFPDPQEKKRRSKKRLTGSRFLNLYKLFLKNGGIVHLKTDNVILYRYTLELIQHNRLHLIASTDNLYQSELEGDTFGIRTYYENLFLAEGKPIHYLRFTLDTDHEIEEPPETPEE
jgi:tRNA (guanine-N7-)-methyltransferase